MTLHLLQLWLRALRLSQHPIPWLDMAKKLVTDRKVDPKLWRQRMRTCQRCVVYDRINRRCATKIGFVDLGCECSMPMKALFDKSTCWARDHNLPYGWNERPEDQTGVDG